MTGQALVTPLPFPADTMAFTLARQDFGVFLDLTFKAVKPGVLLQKAWYLSAMIQSLTEIETGSNRRLQITVPPRHLKSVMTTIAFPAWLLGRDPTVRIICASYGQELSAALSRDFRKVMTSQWYARVFPETAASIVRNTETDVGTSQGGYRYATAVGGTVTGLGADLIIIDDLMKAQDATFPEARARAHRFVDETLLSRLDDKSRGAIVAIQQRLHEDDVSAHLSGKGGFRHLNLPAIAVQDELIPLTRGRVHQRRIGDLLNPGRESRQVLDELKAEMGNRAFETQYQQNPTPAEGDYVQWDRIQFYDERPGRERLHKIVHSWDVAQSTSPTADFSVGTVWGHDGASWLLLDLIRTRLVYSDLLARVRLERRKWRADLIIVENTSMGPALLSELGRDLRGLSAREHNAPNCGRVAADPRLPKAERLFSSVDRLYSGLAKLPRDAPWLDELRREMMTFPNARHDDQVDSVSQFLDWAVGQGGRRIIRDERQADRPRAA